MEHLNDKKSKKDDITEVIFSANTKEVKKAFKILDNFLYEFPAKLYKNGFEVLTLDPTDRCLLNIKFGNCDNEINYNFGLEIDGLVRFINRFKNSEVFIKIDIKNTEFYLFDNKKEYKMPILDVPYKSIKIPEINYDVIFTLNVNELKESLEDIEQVYDNVNFVVKNGEIYLTPSDNVYYTVKSKLNIIDKIKLTERCESTYSLDDIKDLIRPLDKKDIITIKYSKDAPLCIEIKFKTIEILFMLAPIITQ